MLDIVRSNKFRSFLIITRPNHFNDPVLFGQDHVFTFYVHSWRYVHIAL